MAGYSHLATLTLLAAFVNGFWCRTWPNLEYYNMDSFGWEMSVITGVNSLDFTDNFMIPMMHDPMQIMVGNGNGYSPSSGEGCIQIYFLRDRTKPVRKIAGDCSRHINGNFRFKNGEGLAAELMWPDHGYMTKDRQWVLFVDNKRCARRMRTDTFQVTTVIGNCSNGINPGSDGANQKVIGMVYLDEKNLWVFFMLSGMYICPWDGVYWTKLNDRSSMGKYHYLRTTSINEPGLMTKSSHDKFLVYQKVAYGVTSYDFTNVSMEGGLDATTRRLFSLKKYKPHSDPNAQYKYNSINRNFEMSHSNGHVSQHPYYKELLMVTDWHKASIYLLNTDNGKVRQYCSRASGLPYIVTTSNEPNCRFTTLKGTTWVGGSSLSALVVDRTAWLIHQIVLTNNKEQRHNRCVKCWNAPEYNTCYDTRDGAVCVCAIGYEGPDCDIPICNPSQCNGHGQCKSDVTNRVICTCNAGWRGERCNIQRYFSMELAKTNTIIDFTVQRTRAPARSPLNLCPGEGFLLTKLGDPSVLIVGLKDDSWYYASEEGAIGYYRLGRMSNFVYLAGSLERWLGPNRYNDGIGTTAHMVKPQFAYQQKNGKWLHFVDTWSCARRLKLEDQLQVLTWLGAGKCGNGTLDMSHYGTLREVRGMTMMEYSNQNYFLFSGPFGIYLSSWSGSNTRLVVPARETSAYSDKIYGTLAKRKEYPSLVYHNTPYGITRYTFDFVTAHNQKKPSVTRIASLKPYRAQLHQIYDVGAIHHYDKHQGAPFSHYGGVIGHNPSIPNLLMVADRGRDDVILYNMTSGNLLTVCRGHESCPWYFLRSAMWLTATTALASDWLRSGKIYLINFRVGDDGCATSPCGPNGICSDALEGNGFECLCHDDWTGSTCSTHSPRTDAVFPVLGAFDEAGHLMSIGISRSETFSIFTFTAALTSCQFYLSDHY